MLNSLRVTNFRAFRDLHISRLGKVNLIVGRNNVGKTSLLEAVHLYSSGDVINAITACWSFPSAWNFFRLSKDSDMSSVGDSEAIENHLSWRISNAVGRFEGFIVSIRLTTDLASRETLAHCGPLIEYIPLVTLSKISFSFLPMKGGFPHKSMYKMTPQLHMSHLES